MEKLTVGIAGLGMIGGSFAGDLLEQGHGVVGYDCDADACAAAMELGFVHQAATDCTVLDDCEVILIAVPVGAIAQVMHKIANIEATRLRAVFDAGSTKLVPLQAQSKLGSYAKFFVACHPIAGAEHSGIRSAIKGLFRDKQVVLCDPPENSAAVTLTRELWESCGAKLTVMAADKHDRIFAAVSHLPHMLAYLLVGMLGAREGRDELLGFAAGGFTDFTRIASSDPNMWRDVSLNNRHNLLAELDAYATELTQLRHAVENGDGQELHSYFEKARQLRNDWLSKRSS